MAGPVAEDLKDARLAEIQALLRDQQAAFNRSRAGMMAEVLVTGVVDPDSRMHGIDESFDLGDFTNACVAEATLLARLAGLGS